MTEVFETIEISDPAFEQEGLRYATVKSLALGHRADVSFWVPTAPRIDTLLILLHGVYGSHWVWSLKGGAHRAAQQMLDACEISPIVIAMPSDGLRRDGSGYLTWPGGEDVERWIVDEVPSLAKLVAPTLHTNARIAIAGLSMGGYGALRLGSKYPKVFSVIAAHSAITEINDITAFVAEPLTDYLECAAREELSALFWLRKNRRALPPIRFDCGLEDALLANNRQLHAALKQEGIPHEYSEFPGGHDWPYWQARIADMLRHVDRNCRKQGN